MLQQLYKKIFLNIPEYLPLKKTQLKRSLDVTSAWKGIELIIPDIIEHFNLPSESCLEFGVEFGFSTVAFSNYFNQVKGVDIFAGDIHTDHKGDHFELTKRALEPYRNIQLIKADYRDWIKQDQAQYDLIHVDIVHTYRDTYDCGFWSAQHSKCTIFHDTESFIHVRRAVVAIARATGKNVYNYPHCNGLGIIV
jgi:Methyltransferase domain